MEETTDSGLGPSLFLFMHPLSILFLHFLTVEAHPSFLRNADKTCRRALNLWPIHWKRQIAFVALYEHLLEMLILVKGFIIVLFYFF